MCFSNGSRSFLIYILFSFLFHCQVSCLDCMSNTVGVIYKTETAHRVLVTSVLLMLLDFYVVFYGGFECLRTVCSPMLPISLNCPYLISPSFFSNIYMYWYQNILAGIFYCIICLGYLCCYYCIYCDLFTCLL